MEKRGISPKPCRRVGKDILTRLPIRQSAALRRNRPGNLARTSARSRILSAAGHHRHHQGCSRYQKNPAIRIVGAQPTEGSQIPGIRKCPGIPAENIRPQPVDRVVDVAQADAEGKWRAGWRKRREYSPAFHPAAPCGRVGIGRGENATIVTIVWIVAIVICRQACFLPESFSEPASSFRMEARSQTLSGCGRVLPAPSSSLASPCSALQFFKPAAPVIRKRASASR
jgi:hypothetical protein